MSKVLVIATSKKTRGGITSVIKAHKTGEHWKKYHCVWIQTHRDGPVWRKYAYLFFALVEYVFLLPFSDIVHIHHSLGVSTRRKYLFFCLAKLLKKKTIVHIHCGNQLLDIWNDVYQDMYSRCDVGVALSENIKNIIESHVGKTGKVRVIYNPCPTIKNHQRDLQKRKTILFSGTLYAGKGYADLLRAFAKIASRHSDWKIVFAGNGEVEQGMVLANELGIAQQTEFLGWVSGEEKDKAFREASIFCLPSYAEGFPMAVLDAWAYGLPVITTPVGGIPDVAKEGENMLLFKPGDINRLAEQIDRMISDEQLRRVISISSVNFAHGLFNVDSVNAQLGALYAELLEK